MQKRLFTFGCSFTNFSWPTWADILGREFDVFENWGRNGAGNCFMLHSLTECNQRNKLTPSDTVIIMWSSIDRQDRWINGSWRTDGGVYNGQPEYNKQYLDSFADPTGFLLRDLSVISATRYMLEQIGCKWHFLSMVPLTYQDYADEPDIKHYNIDNNIISLYKDDLKFIKPSIFEVVFNNDWYSRPGYVDLEHYKQSYENQAGPDWPSTKNFIAKNFTNIKAHIMQEINQLLRLDKKLIRTDTHPIPEEHLEYLNCVLPEYTISKSTRRWVAEVNKQVLNLDPYYANNFKGKWQTQIPQERF